MTKINLKQIKKGADDKTNWHWNAYLLGWISDYVSWFFAKFLPFTPNQISFIWEFIALAGIFVMCLGGYWGLLAGMLIYHFAILLDYIDGQIARATKHTTLGGAYLDSVFSWVNRSLLMLALGIGLYRGTGEIIWFYLGLSTCLFLFVDNLAKLKVYETLLAKDMLKMLIKYRDDMKRGGLRVQKGSFFKKFKQAFTDIMRPFVPFSILFWTILFGISEIYLIIMAILVPILFIKNFVGIYKEIGNIRA